MPNRERLVFSAVLVLVTIVNLALLGGAGLGRVATAASSLLAELGPADVLRLVDTRGGTAAAGEDDGGSELALRNRGGRLAWGDEAHDRAHAVGLAHVGRLVTGVLETEAYTSRRQDQFEEFQEALAEGQATVEALFERLQEMDQSDPAFPGLREQFNQAYQEYQALEREQIRKDQARFAALITEAYQEVVAAVDAVAERQGIDLVLRFVPQDEPLEPENPQQAQLFVRTRTALHYPEGLDITPAVMEELALDD